MDNNSEVLAQGSVDNIPKAYNPYDIDNLFEVLDPNNLDNIINLGLLDKKQVLKAKRLGKLNTLKEVVRDIILPPSESHNNVKSAERLIHVLFDNPSSECKAVILEAKFFDTDYTDSYISHFLKTYRDFDRWCHRLHFFMVPVSNEEICKLGDKKKSYLGFTVVRPLSCYKIGRTLIKPEHLSKDDHFILSKCKYPVNLAGQELEIEGPLFMQQDSQVSVCATAALWMAQANMAQHTQLPCYTTSQIVEKATHSNRYLGQTNLTPGLDPKQMAEAIQQMGYNPLVLVPMEKKEQMQTIYTYVESQIPVMISIVYPRGHRQLGADNSKSTIELDKKYQLQQHTSIIVGHTATRSENGHVPECEEIGKGLPDKYIRSCHWVPSFIANDDSYGLFKRFELLEYDSDRVFRDFCEIKAKEFGQIGTEVRYLRDFIKSAQIETEVRYLRDLVKRDMDAKHFTWVRFSDSPSDDEKIMYGGIFATIIALPKGVSLVAHKAERLSRRLLQMANEALRNEYKEKYASKFPMLQGMANVELVLRTFLCRSIEFKERFSILETNVSSDIKVMYQRLPMPKYVWVTELTTVSEMRKDHKERKSFGEVVIDSSANPYGTDYIAIRIGNYYMYKTPGRATNSSVVVEAAGGEYLMPILARPSAATRSGARIG